ncbi:MAG: adenosine deaminase [Planctomycetes bacterium]|nr:adenosine deaminase [Planctomycetota bacterium]
MVGEKFISKLPKTDLHVHLDGSLREITLQELAVNFEIEMPQGVFKERYNSLEDYLKGFSFTCAVMRDEQSIQRISYELCVDAFNEGVYYQEIRFAPQLLEHHGLTSLQILQAASAGIAQAETEFNEKSANEVGLYRASIIVCAMRFPEIFSSKSIDAVNAAIDARDNHGLPVVAFDLAGAEFGNPAGAHQQAYKIARDAQLARTVHAGEADGAHSISDAITSCYAQRIGHGTNLLEDDAVLEIVKQQNVLLEVCLTSNLQTMPHLKYLAEHPYRRFVELEVPFTLATDNRLVSRTDICAEYRLAATHGDLSKEQIITIANAGFDAMFFPGSSEQARCYRQAVQVETDKVVASC